MPFCETQNISVLRAEIKLRVTPNDITKIDFAIALNRILPHTLAPPPYGDHQITSLPSSGSMTMSRT